MVSAALSADSLVLLSAALLAAGVLSAAFAAQVRAPALLLFLALGMLIGSDGLGWVNLSYHDAEVAQSFGVLALIVILFEGGLTTKPRDLRSAAAPGLALATVGVLITACVTAGAVLLLTDFDLITAALIGAVVSSTDAAAVFSLLRKAPLPRRITALLEVESGANDPMAILLTVGVLEAWRSDPGWVDWLSFGVLQLAGGLVVGALVGVVGSWTLRRVNLGPVGLYPVLALAVAGLAYGAAAAAGASGFLAVYVAGLIVGAAVPRHRRAIRTFHDGLTNTAEIGLFLLLGLLVFPAELPRVALVGMAAAVALVLVARPLAVLAVLGWPMVRGRWSPSEVTLVAWAGLRGAVPIVLATFALTAGFPGGSVVFNVVFFVVLVSAVVQGSTVSALSRLLGLQERGRVWAPVAEAQPLEGVEADLVEVDVTADLPIAGQRIRDVPLPAGALLTALVRDTGTNIPTGDTCLLPGDHLLVAVPRTGTATAEVVAWARGETPRPRTTRRGDDGRNDDGARQESTGVP